MKIRIFITILLSFSSLLSIGQSSESLFQNADKEYEYIKECLYFYDQKRIDSSDETSEGKKIVGYYEKSSPKLIKILSFGETGKRKIEYYFKNKRLFFVLDVDYRYNRPIYWDEKKAKENNDAEIFDNKKTIIKEDKYYFNNGQLIRWIMHDGRYGDNKLAYFKNLEIQIPRQANEMMEKLNK